MTHTLDAERNQAEIDSPSGSEAHRSFDELNRLTLVEDGSSNDIASWARYGTAKRRDVLSYESGTTTTWGWDGPWRSPKASTRCDAMGLGRRTSKTVGSDTTRFVYAHQQCLEEYDGFGNLLRLLAVGQGIDEVAMMEAPDVADVDGDPNTTETKRLYYHTQLLGSVAQVTDPDEVVVESHDYGPYGEITIKDIGGSTVSGSQIGNAFAYTGRRLDEESGLYYYRARCYSAELKRFVQRDPLEYVAGASAVAYVLGSPARVRDPRGLKGIPVAGAGISIDDPGPTGRKRAGYLPLYGFDGEPVGNYWNPGPLRRDAHADVCYYRGERLTVADYTTMTAVATIATTALGLAGAPAGVVLGGTCIIVILTVAKDGEADREQDARDDDQDERLDDQEKQIQELRDEIERPTKELERARSK